MPEGSQFHFHFHFGRDGTAEVVDAAEAAAKAGKASSRAAAIGAAHAAMALVAPALPLAPPPAAMALVAPALPLVAGIPRAAGASKAVVGQLADNKGKGQQRTIRKAPIAKCPAPELEEIARKPAGARARARDSNAPTARQVKAANAKSKAPELEGLPTALRSHRRLPTPKGPPTTLRPRADDEASNMTEDESEANRSRSR